MGAPHKPITRHKNAAKRKAAERAAAKLTPGEVMDGVEEAFIFGVPASTWHMLPDATKDRLANNYAENQKREQEVKLFVQNVLHGHMLKYEPWMDEAVLEVFAKGGRADSAAIRIGVTLDTLRQWQNQLNPDTGEYRFKSFREAVVKGEAMSEQWWKQKGIDALDGRPFNQKLYSFMMLNMFGYDTAKTSNKNDNVNTNLTWADIVEEAERLKEQGSSNVQQN